MLIFEPFLKNKKNNYEYNKHYSHPLNSFVIFGMEFLVFFVGKEDYYRKKKYKKGCEN
jgi:hypothetical protein